MNEEYYPYQVGEYSPAPYAVQGMDGLDGKIGDWIKAKKRPLLIAVGVSAVVVGAAIVLSQRGRKAKATPAARGLSGVRRQRRKATKPRTHRAKRLLLK